MNRRIILLDTETTGFSPDYGRIVEIAALEVEPRTGQLGQQFYQRLNPERSIPDAATAIHGISITDVQASPTFAEVAKAFESFVAGSILVMHNSAFDTAMLGAALNRVGASSLHKMGIEILDTVEIAKEILPLLPSYSLDALLDSARISREDRTTHGALLDVCLLAKTLPYLAREYDLWESVLEDHCCGALFGFFTKLSEIADPLLVDRTSLSSDGLARDLGSLVTMARWLPKFEERLKNICEPLVSEPGWVCKHLAARFGFAERLSYKSAAEVLLPDVDLSEYQTQSYVYRVAPSIDEAVQRALDDATSQFEAAAAERSTSCMIRAFLSIKQLRSRGEPRREALRHRFLELTRDGFETDLVSVTESERRTTDYRGALSDLAPGADLSPYARQHRRLSVRERSPTAPARLFS